MLGLLTLSGAVRAQEGSPEAILEGCREQLTMVEQADEAKALAAHAALKAEIRRMMSKLMRRNWDDVNNVIQQQAMAYSWGFAMRELVFAEGDPRWEEFQPRLRSLDYGRMKAVPGVVNYYLPLPHEASHVVRAIDYRDQQSNRINLYLTGGTYTKKYDSSVRFPAAAHALWSRLPEACQSRIPRPDRTFINYEHGELTFTPPTEEGSEGVTKNPAVSEVISRPAAASAPTPESATGSTSAR